MQNRLNEALSSPGFRPDSPRTVDAGDPAVALRLAAAVRAGARADLRVSRRTLDALYVAVRDRIRELRQDGRRAEEALMVVKREVMHSLPAGAVDASRAGELVQLVVRWSVAAYYATN
jgi:hypothetical protein